MPKEYSMMRFVSVLVLAFVVDIVPVPATEFPDHVFVEPYGLSVEEIDAIGALYVEPTAEWSCVDVDPMEDLRDLAGLHDIETDRVLRLHEDADTMPVRGRIV
jgi:hypothetical protein